jgi:hypothetical protein
MNSLPDATQKLVIGLGVVLATLHAAPSWAGNAPVVIRPTLVARAPATERDTIMAFYVSAKSVSDKPLQDFRLDFVVQDHFVDLVDVGVAYTGDWRRDAQGNTDPFSDLLIERHPARPQVRTSPKTLSRAVCGVGALREADLARCVFYIRPHPDKLTNLRFAVIARSGNQRLASYVFDQAVSRRLPDGLSEVNPWGSIALNNYLHYTNHKIWARDCRQYQRNGWTKEYGDCFREAQRREPVMSFQYNVGGKYANFCPDVGRLCSER